jgi:hypothetical protein
MRESSAKKWPWLAAGASVIAVFVINACGGHGVNALSGGATTTRKGAPTLSPVVTWHNDGGRTGNNPNETILSPANVRAGLFGKQFSHSTVGQVEAQPLYVPALNIGGQTHNAIFVATMNSMVYAFDADGAAGTNANPLWTANLGPASPAGTGGGGDSYEQGIAGTPVIDTGSKTMYVVTKDGSGSAAAFQLHALDITSGSEKLGGPVTISASFTGTKGGVSGTVALTSPQQYQRVALLELNGIIYIGIGGLDGDTAPCRGFVLGYNATSLQQVSAMTTAPDAGSGSQTAFAGSSIWMAGAGLTTDGTFIYAATGNGDFDASSSGGKDYGDSVIKLQPSTLSVVDYFAPSNQQNLSNADLDLGTGCPMVVPGTTNPYLVQTSKNGTVFVLRRSSLGQFHATDQTVQDLNTGGSFWSSPAYWNGNVYFATEGGPLAGYKLSSIGLGAAFGSTSESFAHTSPSISSNGNTNAIVWEIENNSSAVLCAYQATNMQLLYKAGSSDSAGSFVKFGVPTIANGKVYVPCQNGVYAYGLIPTVDQLPTAKKK